MSSTISNENKEAPTLLSRISYQKYLRITSFDGGDSKRRLAVQIYDNEIFEAE